VLVGRANSAASQLPRTVETDVSVLSDPKHCDSQITEGLSDCKDEFCVVLVVRKCDRDSAALSTNKRRLSKQLSGGVEGNRYMGTNLISREGQSISTDWRCPLGFNQDFYRPLLSTDIDTMLMSVPANTIEV